MLLSVRPQHVQVHDGGSASLHRWPTARVLLASCDLAERSAISAYLRGVSIQLTITISERQAIARASMACSERALRDHSGMDFDLILVDANLLDDPLGFAQCLSEADYSNPLIAFSADLSLKTRFLNAGFADLLPLPQSNPDDFVQALARYCRQSQSQSSRTAAFFAIEHGYRSSFRSNGSELHAASLTYQSR